MYNFGVDESGEKTQTFRMVTPPANPLTVAKRLQKEGRWAEIEPLRDQMMREARKGGMLKEEAQAWVYGELDRMYPPNVSEIVSIDGDGVSDAEQAGEDSLTLTHAREGLGALPPDWPDLPDNAPLPAELSWVQAQRLRVVEERPGGQTVVRLSRAGCPPPSWAALGWLDTSIRNPAKFVDVAAKGLGQQELEPDVTKRERRSIEDVRRLLGETAPP